ncbi:MAG: hypothetical protein U9R28_04715 [Pseudomonadota bacterium]|nr:hypothetical protein [Pseudomonadota bacterium]
MNNSNHDSLSSLSKFYQKNSDVKLEGNTEDNKKMRVFFYQIALGGLKGNRLEFELSEDKVIYERENTLSEILDKNPSIFDHVRSKKQARNMSNEAFRFFMERGHVIKAFKVHQKACNGFWAFLKLLFIPKLIATSLFGIFAVLSSGELIKFADIIANHTNNIYMFLASMGVIFVLYFGLIDLRYLRPKLKFWHAIIRGIFPTVLLLIYMLLGWVLTVILIGFDGLYTIGDLECSEENNMFVLALTFVSGVFSILLQSLWDRESVLRPI